MKENPVHVSWPCRLKIGAKTRKGEHSEYFNGRQNLKLMILMIVYHLKPF